MTVLDTSGAVDHLLGRGAHARVAELLSGGTVAAPDVLVFEVLAVLRRLVLRGELGEERAEAAVEDLGDLSIELFASLTLRDAAWTMRRSLTIADALFASLARELDEPLATKDSGLAAVAEDAGLAVLRLGST